jgi:hypothetical protein
VMTTGASGTVNSLTDALDRLKEEIVLIFGYI